MQERSHNLESFFPRPYYKFEGLNYLELKNEKDITKLEDYLIEINH